MRHLGTAVREFLAPGLAVGTDRWLQPSGRCSRSAAATAAALPALELPHYFARQQAFFETKTCRVQALCLSKAAERP